MSNLQGTFIEEFKKQEAKSSLTNLIREVGFSEVISCVGELAKEKESIIESKNNSALSSCFEMAVLLLIDAYPRSSVSHKKLIRQVLTGNHFEEGLTTVA